MAAMKHGKGRNHRQGPGYALPGKGRGDRGLREMLAKEYGVEKTPRSFHKNFEKTLLELPEDMPVRRRPVFTLLRGAAMAMAALVVTFAGLFGLNANYPQLTESLPGLGQVFQAMNSGQLRGNGRTPDVPEATPQPEKSFEPVRVEGTGWGIEDLQVDSAWCDGQTLCLELSLGLSDDLKEYWDPAGVVDGGEDVRCLRAGSMTGYWGEYGEEQSVGEDYTIEVAAGGESYRGSGELSDFTADDGVRVRAVWQLELDEDMRQAVARADEVNVDFFLPSLTLVKFSEPVETLETGFNVKFAVPVDTSEDRRFTKQTVDNSATLLVVDYAPSQVIIEMELPFIGYYGDMMVYPNWDEWYTGNYAAARPYKDKYTTDSGTALGIFPVLEGLGDQDAAYALERLEAMEDTAAEAGTRNRMRFVFRPEGGKVRAQAAPLRLTVYEAPYGDILPFGRVVTELTIHLDTGRVTPSENFSAEGREKVDTSQDYLYPRGAGCFINDFLCSWIWLRDGESSRISLLTPYPGEPRTLLFNGWSEKGELVYSIPVPVDLEQADLWNGDESWDCQQTLVELPGSGQRYLLLQIELWEFRNMIDAGWDEEAVPPVVRLELMDSDTGETLIDDLSAAYESALREIWGGPLDAPITGTEVPGSIAEADMDVG